MLDLPLKKVAIVDYGLGNLFSVKHALKYVGVPAEVTSHRDTILNADAVVLPGVGAFGDAMDSLQHLDLVSPLREVAASGGLMVGICLGMQLLMTESAEFGMHQGLDLIAGEVLPLSSCSTVIDSQKVPHIGWSRIFADQDDHCAEQPWSGSLLDGITGGEFMYFVHSFYVEPQESSVVLSRSRHGDLKFCSSLQQGNIFACQFHPERSGRQGLKVYQNLASLIWTSSPEGSQST